MNNNKSIKWYHRLIGAAIVAALLVGVIEVYYLYSGYTGSALKAVVISFILYTVVFAASDWVGDRIKNYYKKKSPSK